MARTWIPRNPYGYLPYILLYFFQVGGVDLIEDIAKGKVEIIDYDYFLAHEDIAAGTRPYVNTIFSPSLFFPGRILG
jgi:hypothetical protein